MWRMNESASIQNAMMSPLRRHSALNTSRTKRWW